MKKSLTYLLSCLTLILLLSVAFPGMAQQGFTPADTAAKKPFFKPSGRLWGYAFGDFYYKSHSDSLNRGGSNQYTNVGKNRNGFQLRRVYLGYDYDISKKFSAEVLLAAEDNVSDGGQGVPSTVTSPTGDALADNKLSLYIKLLNIRWKNIFKGSDLVFGQVFSPAFPMLTEKVWGYRSVERTVSDIRRTPSFDLGASLQGTFDPETKNFGYNVMVANGTQAKPENDAFKWFYADVYAKFFNKRLILDLYADYNQYSFPKGAVVAVPASGSSAAIAGLPANSATSRRMIKGFIAWTTPKLTVGVEAFANTLKGGALTTTTDGTKTKAYNTINAVALSAYVRGPIVKDKLGFFARYDTYNPDNTFNKALAYSAPLVSQYDPNTKEQFVTAGLDFTPIPNVHIEPNIWTVKYTGQQANLAGKAASDYDLVYRLTAYFIFGK